MTPHDHASDDAQHPPSDEELPTRTVTPFMFDPATCSAAAKATLDADQAQLDYWAAEPHAGVEVWDMTDAQARAWLRWNEGNAEVSSRTHDALIGLAAALDCNVADIPTHTMNLRPFCEVLL